MAGSIWNVDPETGIADELAYGPKYLSSPAWSPDGKSLVYTADEDNQTIQLESSERRDRRDPRADAGHVHLHRSGLLARRDAPGIRLDATQRVLQHLRPPDQERPVGRRRRCRSRRTTASRAIVCTSASTDVHIEPAWTRDGKSLLVVSNRDVPLGSGNVWKIPVEADAMAEGEAGAGGAVAVPRSGPTFRSTASGSSTRRTGAPPISTTTSTSCRSTAASPTR